MFDANGTDYGDGVVCTLGFPLPEEQNEAVLQLQQDVARCSRIAYFFSPEIPPLIRLYETVLPVDSVEKVKAQIHRLVNEMKPFRIAWREIEETAHSVILWGERNPVLIDFQQAILLAIQPYRAGYFKQKYTAQEYLTPEEKKSVEQWGWPWVESYEPYLVIAKAENDLPVGTLNLEWEFNTVLIDQLLIAEKKNHRLIHPLSSHFKK